MFDDKLARHLRTISRQWQDDLANYDYWVRDITPAELDHGIPGWRIDAATGLGINYRLRVAWRWSGLEQGPFTRNCSAEFADRIYHALRPKRVSVVHPTIGAVVDWVNLNRRLKRGGAQAITKHDFMYKSFTGADAVFDFARWIMALPKSHHALELLGGGGSTDWFAPTSLKQLTNDVKSFVSSEGERTFFNIHQRGLRSGMSAFARHICHELTDGSLSSVVGERPVVYLPSGPRAEDNRRVSAPQMIGWLQAFYANEPLISAKAPDNGAELAKAIDAVRFGLATQPSIIVIGDCVSTGTNIAALRGLIMGEPVHELLPLLVHPLEGGPDAPVDPEVFGKTRIIVLSDMRVAGFEPFAVAKGAPLPDTDQLIKVISDKRFKHPDRIRAILKAHGGANSELDVVMLDALIELSRRLATEDAADVEAIGAEDAFDRYVQVLAAHEEEDVVALHFLALCSDGCRLRTLQRFLMGWRRTITGGEKASCTLDEIEAFANRHSTLLIQMRDDPLPGEDTDLARQRAPEGDDSHVGATDPFAMIDFKMRELRELVLPYLARRTSGTELARLHRIISEECLRQQSELMRRGPIYSGQDTRFMRRLFQAVFHGLCSIATDRGERDETLKRLKKVLPINRHRAFTRLYAIFYRMLQEAPPNWDLARMRGKERLKSDILMVAGSIERMTPRQPNPFYVRFEEFDPALPQFLTAVDGEAAAPAFSVAFELAMGMARTFANAGDVARVSSARDLLTQFLSRMRDAQSMQTPEGVAALDRADISMARFRADVLMLNDDVANVQPDLARLGFPATTWVELSKLRNEAYECTDVGALSAMVSKRTDDLADVCLKSKPDVETLRAWADLLSRQAESQALAADRAHLDRGPVPDLTLAYLAMRLADRLRREAFQRRPLGQEHLAESHSIRAFIRICLKLANQANEAKLFGCDVKNYFGDYARRQADLLARYFFRFPTERPSMLIIEAQFERLLNDDLIAAEHALAHAERLMVATEERPRVRMRLLLERSKLFSLRADAVREAAKAIEEEEEREAAEAKAERLAQAALRDARRLSSLASQFKQPPWMRMAKSRLEDLGEAPAT